MNISETQIFSSLEFEDLVKGFKPTVVFGGTFDPIHEGHIQDIRFLKRCAERVIIAPTSQNPWKENPPASLEDRVEMIKLVLEYEEIPFSLNRSDPGIVIMEEHYVYAIDIVNILRTEHYETLFWAIGADLKDSALEWKDWKQSGIPMVCLPLLPDASGTAVREHSRPPHPAIADYITQNKLYL